METSAGLTGFNRLRVQRTAMKTNPRLSTVILVLAAAAVCALPAIAKAQALTNEQARAIVAPFYQALNAGNDPAP
jgi:hypothetical protein